MIETIDERYLGNVYTTDELADFIAQVVVEEYFVKANDKKKKPLNILDPACGDGALLMAVNNMLCNYKNRIIPDKIKLIGLDISDTAIKDLKNRFSSVEIKNEKTDRLYLEVIDTVMPIKDKDIANYWREKLGTIDIVIANPPWGADKVYNNRELSNVGYVLNKGQFDSYVLFVELCVKILKENGVGIFILPDSLFLGENKELREYLLKNTEIKLLARLGEKLFPNVNRATSIVMIKKVKKINEQTLTKCFRLDTLGRNAVLTGQGKLYDLLNKKAHKVRQSRFLNSSNFNFDIDIKEEEENVVEKLEQGAIEWKKMFEFSRGVEISKEGELVQCNHCNTWQGYIKKQKEAGQKVCGTCKKKIDMNLAKYDKIICNDEKEHFVKVLVGENICRYTISNNRYIKLDVQGIDYKKKEIYCKPKILIRKTGLGITATIDRNKSLVTQTVYICTLNLQYEHLPLAYFLGVLNSRVMLYYYLKKFGENEWKSHPYLTKQIIFALPLKAITESNMHIVQDIASKVNEILSEGYSKEIDLEIEKMVCQLYHLTTQEIKMIMDEINNLPDLEAFRSMKYKV